MLTDFTAATITLYTIVALILVRLLFPLLPWRRVVEFCTGSDFIRAGIKTGFGRVRVTCLKVTFGLGWIGIFGPWTGQNCNFSPCWPLTWRTPLQSQCTPNNIPFQSPFEVTYCSPHAQPPSWRPSLVAKKTCKSCILADIWTQHLTYVKQECWTLGYSFRGTEENFRLSVNQMHSEVSPFPYSKT
jgi:hypothetical protein